MSHSVPRTSLKDKTEAEILAHRAALAKARRAEDKERRRQVLQANRERIAEEIAQRYLVAEEDGFINKEAQQLERTVLANLGADYHQAKASRLQFLRTAVAEDAVDRVRETVEPSTAERTRTAASAGQSAMTRPMPALTAAAAQLTLENRADEGAVAVATVQRAPLQRAPLLALPPANEAFLQMHGAGGTNPDFFQGRG